jgi:hypothetical protein
LSRNHPYEICAICETMHPASEMCDKYVRNAETGLPVRLRICRSCLHPRTTYIQSRMLPAFAFDVPRTLMEALASVLVALNVIFGLIVGGSMGFAVALTAIMVGAGILVTVAASCIQSS